MVNILLTCRKVEDLQFTIEEASIDKGDLEASETDRRNRSK